MKKIVISMIVVIVLLLSGFSAGFAATKYDCIVKDPNFQKIVKQTNSELAKNRVLNNYVSLLVSAEDIDSIIADGDISKEKKQFLKENKKVFLSYLKFILIAKGVSTLKPGPKDSEFIYITNVIKMHNRGESITSVSKNQVVDPAKMEIEKALFEGHVLYTFYQHIREPGLIEKLCDEDIENWYKIAKK